MGEHFFKEKIANKKMFKTQKPYIMSKENN
jgi:hypothetical protein